MSTNVIPGHIPSKDDPALMKAVIEADLDRAGVCLLPSQRARIRALKPDDPHGDDLYYVVAHLVRVQEALDRTRADLAAVNYHTIQDLRRRLADAHRF
jgi:hypothetical protein